MKNDEWLRQNRNLQKNDEGLRRNRSLRKLNNKKKPKTAIQKARLRFRFLFGNQHEGIFTIEIGW